MRPKFWMMLAITTVLILAGIGALAMPKSEYFCQDDFVLSFGAIGDPMAAGTTITADGRLLLWDSNTIAGWFTMTGTLKPVSQPGNGTWQLVFDSGTFKVMSSPINGTTYWQGNISNLTMTGYDQSSATYSAAGYQRPGYVTDPAEYLSVGTAIFTRTDGTWTDPELHMNWLGSYNWTYDNATPATSNNLLGNLQAELSTPEPGSIAALFCGLTGMVGYWRRKRS